LGISISKRVEPSSVRRNRVKRLIREQFRAKSRQGQGCDLVVRMRKQPGQNDLARFIADLNLAIEKALTIKA
jgi:ribonuclease P protein component